MTLKTLYESDFYRIQINLEHELLLARWLRPIETQEVILSGTKLYETLQQTQVQRVLTNAQAVTTLSAEAKEWMSTTFHQLLSQTNIEKFARVLPSTIFF